MHKPVPTFARSLSRPGDNFAKSCRAYFGSLGKERRIVSLSEAASRLGQRSHASLGPVANVSKPCLLFARSAFRGRRTEIRRQKSEDGRPKAQIRRQKIAGSRQLTSDKRNHMSEQILSFKDLRVYKLAFELQEEIFGISKRFPAEERYALTDQVRRASRSIGANLAEAWQKRRYIAHF